MKILNIIGRVLLGLIALMPVLGFLGVFPEPTPDLYNTPEAYAFIMTLMGGYMMMLVAGVCALTIIFIAMNRMALAALLLLPVTVNVIAFHLFLDGGLLTGGAVMGNMMLLLNCYFLWQNCDSYKILLKK